MAMEMIKKNLRLYCPKCTNEVLVGDDRHLGTKEATLYCSCGEWVLLKYHVMQGTHDWEIHPYHRSEKYDSNPSTTR